jgi:hypothetical protein
MVQLYCYFVSLLSFAAMTLCVASRVFIVVSIYFVTDSFQKLLDTPSWSIHKVMFNNECIFHLWKTHVCTLNAQKQVIPQLTDHSRLASLRCSSVPHIHTSISMFWFSVTKVLTPAWVAQLQYLTTWIQLTCFQSGWNKFLARCYESQCLCS